MATTTIPSFLDWPNPPKEAPSAAWPRYLHNAETRDHLSGKKLSPSVLKLELEKLRVVWRQVQHTRQRDAVYEFLEAAYGVVSKFNRAGDGRKLLRTLPFASFRAAKKLPAFSLSPTNHPMALDVGKGRRFWCGSCVAGIF